MLLLLSERRPIGVHLQVDLLGVHGNILAELLRSHCVTVRHLGPGTAVCWQALFLARLLEQVAAIIRG